MDTTKLQAFCAVAELKNYSEAARRLNYTQPAISAQIRELENELKVPLFKKSGKTVDLSVAGKAILPFAHRLLKSVQEMRDALPGSETHDSRIVKIGSSSLPGVHLVPGLMEKASAVYPDISFTLSINNNYQVERMLYANQIEVGFAGRKRMRASAGALTEHLLFKDDLIAVMPPSHPLAHRSDLRVEELADLPMVLPPRNILTRRQVEERFHQMGFSLNIALEVANTEAIKHLVEHKLGITVLCRSAVQQEVAESRLCAISVLGLDLSRYFCLLTDENQKRSRASSQFIEFVLDKAIANRTFPTY
ncbi:MAG: hypothetical protein CVV47_15540 [Spirochaetae bacterium HGW-Spirochaetae-3]|jgi:DNA-binding transcriptional LysR family regulator|nr:MAG: hypothetical protein CVV47_15540 [Spirochaetae bacterium HGW-Spirochaetae-3]